MLDVFLVLYCLKWLFQLIVDFVEHFQDKANGVK